MKATQLNCTIRPGRLKPAPVPWLDQPAVALSPAGRASSAGRVWLRDSLRRTISTLRGGAQQQGSVSAMGTEEG
jgi:hypothetical protein